jgi:small subunit ribosomal protein S9
MAAEDQTNEFLGTGRRKTAIARVRLASGSGKITVNGRAFENYFPLETLRSTVTQPLTLTGTAEKFDVRVNVTGGGPQRPGRRGAARHCPRAAEVRRQPAAALKAEGLLTRDSRMNASARNTASRARANASSTRNVDRTGNFQPRWQSGGVFCLNPGTGCRRPSKKIWVADTATLL